MKAKMVLCDDKGNVLPDSSLTAYSFKLGGQSLDEIEQAVEQFRHQALPELEANLLKSAQEQKTYELKNRIDYPQRQKTNNAQVLAW